MYMFIGLTRFIKPRRDTLTLKNHWLLSDFSCGKKAKERGYNYFCIEFYGECWGYTYKQLDIPDETADPGKCWGKRPIYDKCDHTQDNPICVGVASHGYVYELQVNCDEEGSIFKGAVIKTQK